MAKCAGFPKGPCSGQTNRNPNWCDECDDKRIDHLTKQFEDIAQEKSTR